MLCKIICIMEMDNSLLMRFYEIDGGRITLDGVDTSRMDRGELRQ